MCLSVIVSKLAFSLAAALTVTVWAVFQWSVVKSRLVCSPSILLLVSMLTLFPVPLTVTVTAALG
ncbi:MAG: hypothetical protein TH68_04265 [Candidatus Synechococcus spongiarum 142]|uniref:Uncharacterized protein n=1 Tax=Candidatus Synechococcus spongiarum 142 TaxID=1608213 RepID=A0A6N3XCQ3_9SYNE|nr:MAG: hypothetical protein TH68_04265 [Candidatus Synechococcus spongiarum 142]